ISLKELYNEHEQIKQNINHPIVNCCFIAVPRCQTDTLTCVSGYADTVPMPMRQDPVTGAAEIITAFNSIVQTEDGAPAVGTVGDLKVTPGGRSIIPEKVEFTIDLRDSDLARRDGYEQQLKETVKAVSEKHRLNHEISDDGGTTPKESSKEIMTIMSEESETMNLAPPVLMSGAFHDASHMA